MKAVCGLDVHKDSVYLCILSEFGELIEKVFGVLTYELEEMRDLMLHHHVVEVSMESTSVYWIRKRIRDAAFFLIIMLVTFAATLLNPQKYVSSRTIQKCVEHVSTST